MTAVLLPRRVGAGLLLLGHRTLDTLHVVPVMAPAMANAD
jgi:hypothetical protein